MTSEEHPVRTNRGTIEPYYWLLGTVILAAVGVLVLTVVRALNGDYSGILLIGIAFGVFVLPYVVGKYAFKFLHKWSAKQLTREYND